jgi:hypothetical protein
LPTDWLRAFLAWLDEAQPRLAVAVNIDQSTPEGVEFSFALTNPVLRGGLGNHGEITVSADWANENWDFLLDLDVRAAAT